MKKKLLLFLLMFIFITNVSALTFDVNLTNIEDNGSDNFGSIENIDIPNKKMDILFEDLTSIVKFKISITNSGNKAGTLKSIGFNSSNDYIKYTSNLPEDGLSIDAEGTNTVIVTASLKEGAINGSSSSTIKITYNFDEGTCPEGEVLSEDESMCLCPAGKGRNEDGICEVLPINYRITYVLNGGSLATGVTNPATFTVESDDITLNNPSKQGYTFTGWTGGGYSEPTISVTIPSGSTGSRTYTANYEINSYILTVNPNGGIYNSSVNPVPIPNDYGTVIVLDNPTKNGYTFTGWSLEGNGSLTGNTYTYAEGNGEVTANYSINTYNITYDGLTPEEISALGNPTSYTVEDDITLATPSDKLDADGDVYKRFTGWTDGTSSVEGRIPQGSTGNKHFVATFVDVNPDTYTITYHLDGGSVSTENPTSYTKKIATFTLNNPTKEGYTFAGWTGTGLSEPTITVTIPRLSTGDREYTATYTTISYPINYNLNGGSVSGNPNTYNIESDGFTLIHPTKEGYSFTGWTGSNGTTPGDVTIPKGSIGEKTYTANYDPIVYNVAYDLDGGSLATGVTNPNTFTIESGNITINNPTKEGYTFAGWTGAGLSEPTNNLTISSGSIGNRSYIATYTPINYNITYNLNGGSVSENNPPTYTIETDTFTLHNPSKEGYTFVGWTGTGLDNKIETVTINKGSTGNRTYTANFDINRYTLTVNPNGGSYNGSINPVPIPNDYGTVITLDTPTRLGYIFNDWTLDGKGSLVGNSYTYAEGNGTLTANYTINTYDITYEGLTDEEKAALNLPTSYTVEDNITLPTPSDKLDTDGDVYERFTGWTIDGTTSDGIIPAGSTEAKNCVANFIHVDPDTYTITYHLDGGLLVEDNPTSYTKKTNTFILNNPTKEGYDFAGWTGTGLSEATETVTIPRLSNGDREYTATYTPISYPINYNLNGGSVSSNPGSYTIETDTFTLINPTKEGYTFTGWTGSNGTTPGDVTINKGSTGEKTYTANYAPIKYSITYNLDGGSISEANPATFTIESDSITLHNPTKEGYTFTGWTGTGISELTENLTINSGSIGDREYIAHYKRIACNDDEIYNESKNICEKTGIPITPSNPKTSDNIILISLLFIVSGLGIYASIFKKIKTYKQKKNVGIAIGIITFSLSFIVLASFFGLSKLLSAIINPVTKKQEIVINVDEKIELIEKWDGECSLEVSELTPENIFEGGSGLEQDPYQIETGEQLSCFAKSVNNGTTYEGKFVKQTKNIDLSTRAWTPIGYGDNDTEIAPFKGTYDGNNKAITNLFITSSASSTVLNQNASMGLFGFTYNSTIKNLIIPNVMVSSSNKIGILIGMAKGNLSVNNIKINNTTNGTYAFSSSYAGGLISTYSGNDEGTLTIENVTNNLNIGGCKDYCSGIVSYVSGVADSTEPNIIFRNIIYNGKIFSSYTKYVGGIVGYINSSNANVLFDNCSNNANIYQGGTQNDLGHVGGIAGYISANKVVAKDSSNSGLFEEYSLPNIGGLFGSVYSNYFTPTNLDNTGTIHCGNHCSGIIGYLSSSQISEEPNIIFRNVSNNGEIFSTKMNSVGGIIGEISSSQSGTNILIDNCSNGQRIYNYGGRSDNEYVGGLAGYITTKVLTISNSNNEGKLDNMYASNVGGLVGRVDSRNLTVDNSHNIGDIDCNPSGFSDYSTHGSSSYGPRFTQVGGLFGEINDPFTITNTYNTGNISGPYYYTGGIVGFAYGATSTIENSYNTGNITGAYQTGGLAGYYNDIINKSYNTGDIVIFSGNYVGGLIGFGQGKIYESYNTGNIAARTYSGQYVGGLCSSDCQYIQNSYNRGNIEIKYDNWSYVGGISGRSGVLKNVYNTGNIVFLDNKASDFGSYGVVHVGGIDGDEASSVQNGYNLGNITLTQNSNQSAKAYELSGISTINSYGLQEISNSVNTGNITFIVKYPNLTTNNRIDISGISVRSGNVINSFNSGILTIDDSNLTTSLDDAGLGSIKYIGEIQSGYNANSTGNKFKNQSGKALGCYGIDSSCTLEQNNATGSYTTENVPSILSIINGDNKFNTELDEDGLPTLKAFND